MLAKGQLDNLSFTPQIVEQRAFRKFGANNSLSDVENIAAV